MSKYKLIVFDLDGTLLDTTVGIIKSVKETISYFELPEISDEIICSFIGPPIQDSLQKYCGIHGEILQNATDYFRKIYSRNNLLYASIYNGIYELLQFLKDNEFICAVATYKREDYAITLLKSFSFDTYSDIMVGADNDNLLKKKDIILKCIDKANISDISEVLMIGDTIHDYNGAVQLGIDFLAVTYGFGFKNKKDCESLHCIAIVDSPKEIMNILNL